MNIKRTIHKYSGYEWKPMAGGKWFDGGVEHVGEGVPPSGLLEGLPDGALTDDKFLIVVVDFDGEVPPEVHFIDVKVVPKTYTVNHSA